MRQQIEAFLQQLSTEKRFSSNTVAAYRNKRWLIDVAGHAMCLLGVDRRGEQTLRR